MPTPRNEVIYSKDFLRDVRHLPLEVREKLSELMEVLQENPFDSKLHTKPLSAPLQGIFSFRIVRDYRVGFKFYAPRVILLLAADKRDQIYKRLQRKS